MGDGPDTEGVWTPYRPETSYAPTMLLFSWALLPVGFQILMVMFQRFENARMPLALFSTVALLVPFSTGLNQRKGSVRTHAVQLAIIGFSMTGFFLLVIWALDLREWWWVPYGLTVGCVPLMFNALDGLARSNQPGWQRSWLPSASVPVLKAFPEWNVVTARWTPSVMAWIRTDLGHVAVMYGHKDEEGQPNLRIEPLMPIEAEAELMFGIRWEHLNTPFSGSDEES